VATGTPGALAVTARSRERRNRRNHHHPSAALKTAPRIDPARALSNG
jgi:hypothetical protein